MRCLAAVSPPAPAPNSKLGHLLDPVDGEKLSLLQPEKTADVEPQRRRKQSKGDYGEGLGTSKETKQDHYWTKEIIQRTLGRWTLFPDHSLQANEKRERESKTARKMARVKQRGKGNGQG